MMNLKLRLVFFFIATVFLIPQQVLAANDIDDCPVGLLNNVTLDDEFGPGTQKLTRCLRKRKKVKVIYQANKECRDAACSRSYALGNIRNAIKDYEITHGISRGDYKIVLVAHSGGANLMVRNDNLPAGISVNHFEDEVKDLLDKGVGIFLCQNTARSKGIKTENLIPGVQYVTAGVTAITDFQAIGYQYIQP